MTDGPGQALHGLLDREPTVADIPSTARNKQFFDNPSAVISNAVREGIVAANQEVYNAALKGTKDALAANDEHFRELVREGSAGAYRPRNL